MECGGSDARHGQRAIGDCLQCRAVIPQPAQGPREILLRQMLQQLPYRRRAARAVRIETGRMFHRRPDISTRSSCGGFCIRAFQPCRSVPHATQISMASATSRAPPSSPAPPQGPPSGRRHCASRPQRRSWRPARCDRGGRGWPARRPDPPAASPVPWSVVLPGTGDQDLDPARLAQHIAVHIIAMAITGGGGERIVSFGFFAPDAAADRFFGRAGHQALYPQTSE